MGGLSPFHWLVVAVIVLLLFGNRLPSVMRSLGQGVVEFKKGLNGIEDEIKNSSTRIEESSKPQATTEESKPSEVKSA
jgi:sec-independent protein translocase protein TatA